jgi:hypothetical protein
VVDKHTGLLTPFLATLLNALPFPCFRKRSTGQVTDRSVPSPDDVRVFEQIIAEWDTQGLGGTRNFHEIIDLALQLMQCDLDSACKDEVIEDLQREIAYRHWCASLGLKIDAISI